MKLQQIKYIREVARNQLNLTTTAKQLHTSQPGISRQVRDLEVELGIDIFMRQGKRFTAITLPGEAAIEISERIMEEVENLKRIASDFRADTGGTLTIAATHMQARYFLPPIIKKFVRAFPNVVLSIRQGNPRQLAEMVASGEADLAIATETLDRFEELQTWECYRWHHCVVVPKTHPLVKEKKLTLKRIAEYPIVTYDAAFTGRTALDETFTQAGLETKIVLTAIDTDVIKAYVRLGLGIGIIANQAVDPRVDSDLVALPADKLFPERVTKVAHRKRAYLRGYTRDLLSQLSEGAAAHFKSNRSGNLG